MYPFIGWCGRECCRQWWGGGQGMEWTWLIPTASNVIQHHPTPSNSIQRHPTASIMQGHTQIMGATYDSHKCKRHVYIQRHPTTSNNTHWHPTTSTQQHPTTPQSQHHTRINHTITRMQPNPCTFRFYPRNSKGHPTASNSIQQQSTATNSIQQPLHIQDLSKE